MISIASYLDTIADQHAVRYVNDSALVTCANGWGVSVTWHPGAYASNRIYMAMPREEWPSAAALRHATAVEVAIFEPGGKFFVPHPDDDAYCTDTQVWGWRSALEVDAVLEAVSRIPAGGRPASCPCPECVPVMAGGAS